MTRLNSIFDHPLFVGFERLAESAAKMPVVGYPPYNIKKTDENKYAIEMAVAGFGIEDISIELADGKLVIKGNTEAEQDTKAEILYQGLAMRPFTRQFTLHEHVEITGASLTHGILRIDLEYVIPEHKKPKTIKINKGT
jgi:molecular chaperone IbpA